MNITILFAIRNILRHKVRSLMSLLMITGAIISSIVFQGFSDDTIQTMTDIAANTQFGHIQIANNKYWNPGDEERSERMITFEELKNATSGFNNIENISGRLQHLGLVSSNKLSVASQIVGIDIENEKNFFKAISLTPPLSKLTPSKRIFIGNLLAKKLKLKIGDEVTVLTTSIDGVMNALDFKLEGIFISGIDEIDAQLIYLDLINLQKLIDTEKIDHGIIWLKNLKESSLMAQKINQTSSNNIKARDWYDLANLFRQVEKFYNIQNFIVELILTTLMFFGILNAVSMNVFERIGEIGIMRSMGIKKTKIYSQFMIEIIIIFFISVALAILCSKTIILFVHYLDIRTELPGASNPFKININFLPVAVLKSSFITFITIFIATMIPLKSALKTEIIESLRRNI